MRAKLILGIMFVVFILVACVPKASPAPTKTTIPSQTSTPFLPTPTSTPTIQWVLVTPLNLPSDKSGEIFSIIDQLHPTLCVGENLLTSNLTPLEPGHRVSSLTFTEISALPVPNPKYNNERADNIDKSRTALTGCQPRNCGKLYVQDNKAGRFYEINVGATTTDRPFDYLQWINKDTFIVAQPGHLWVLFVAINVARQQYEYYGWTSGCHPTPTP